MGTRPAWTRIRSSFAMSARKASSSCKPSFIAKRNMIRHWSRRSPAGSLSIGSLFECPAWFINLIVVSGIVVPRSRHRLYNSLTFIRSRHGMATVFLQSGRDACGDRGGSRRYSVSAGFMKKSKQAKKNFQPIKFRNQKATKNLIFSFWISGFQIHTCLRNSTTSSCSVTGTPVDNDDTASPANTTPTTRHKLAVAPIFVPPVTGFHVGFVYSICDRLWITTKSGKRDP